MSRLFTNLPKEICGQVAAFFEFDDFEDIFSISKTVFAGAGALDHVWSREAQRAVNNPGGGLLEAGQPKPNEPQPKTKEEAKKLLNRVFFVCFKCNKLERDDLDPRDKRQRVSTCEMHGGEEHLFCPPCAEDFEADMQWDPAKFCQRCAKELEGEDEEEEDEEGSEQDDDDEEEEEVLPPPSKKLRA
jgi:hypothetical protein